MRCDPARQCLHILAIDAHASNDAMSCDQTNLVGSSIFKSIACIKPCQVPLAKIPAERTLAISEFSGHDFLVFYASAKSFLS